MPMDASQLLADLSTRMEQLSDEAPELTAAFVNMDSAAYVEGELERKYKELIGIGVAVAMRCSHCLTIHVKQSLYEGATREEILEAAAVGVAFGGSPAMAQVATVLVPALEEFEEQ